MGGLIPLADASRQTFFPRERNPVSYWEVCRIPNDANVGAIRDSHGEESAAESPERSFDRDLSCSGKCWNLFAVQLICLRARLHTNACESLWVSQCCDAGLSPDRTGGQGTPLPSGRSSYFYKGSTEISGRDPVITTF